MSLDGFREKVEAAALQRKGEAIFNASTDHAAIIAEVMFGTAMKRMRILTGALFAPVYATDAALANAKKFLDERNGKLSILIEHADDAGDHPFFQRFGAHRNVEVRVVPDELQTTYSYHLLVADDDSYRFERDKLNHSAVAAFGDRAGAASLGSVFDDLWTNTPKSAVAIGRTELVTT